MKYAVALVALVLAATGCASDSDDPDRAIDPGRTPSSGEPEPTIPEPVIVMDVRRPELCLGPVAESYPPQCDGPPIRGWRWSDHEGHYDQVGEVRWGEFLVEGEWDDGTFVLTNAEPAPPPPTG